MKVMISQPMKGKTGDEIKKERERVIKGLEKLHIEVVDTYFEDDVPNNDRAGIYLLSKSLLKMCEVDAIIFIGNWRQARGCIIEYEVACRYGVKVLTEDFLDNSHIIGLSRTTENILDKPFKVNVDELRDRLTKEINEIEVI